MARTELKGSIDKVKGFIAVPGPIEFHSGDPLRGGKVTRTVLDPSADWPGGHGEVGSVNNAQMDAGFLARYCNNLRGLGVPHGGLWTEGNGGESYATLDALYKEAGVTVPITWMALSDFALLNIPTTQRSGMMLEQYESLVGRPDPNNRTGVLGSNANNPFWVSVPSLPPGFAWTRPNGQHVMNIAGLPGNEKPNLVLPIGELLPDPTPVKILSPVEKLRAIDPIVKGAVNNHPGKEGGPEVRAWAKDTLTDLKKIASIVGQVTLLVLAIVLLSGCGSSGVLREIFTSITPADAQFDGVKSGPVRSLTAAFLEDIDPRAASVAKVAFEGLGQRDPAGWILPVNVVGETSPRLVKCTGDYQDKCNAIPINAVVHFGGSPEGRYWRISRLTADNFND